MAFAASARGAGPSEYLEGSSDLPTRAATALHCGPPVRFKLKLNPQNRAFFDLLSQSSANAVQIGGLLVELLDRFPEDHAGLVSRIKDVEHEGDRLTQNVVDMLNRTFVTPFDRDDIYRLAGALDDICDHVDEAADNIGFYGVTVIPPEAKAQASVIQRAAIELAETVELLDGFKDASQHLAELRQLEDDGDRLLREAVAGLFRSSHDPLTIIKWKDIHQQLEEAVDACENAADTLEAILVKNR
jgi:predicted phosphate transport protein (TIGR00153 family)